MQLAIFNGSPRGMTSNTKKLLDHFHNGFKNEGGEVVQVDYLIKEKYLEEQVQHFKEANNILLAFPLYVDSVPGVVKQFIEAIGNYDGSDVNIWFFVHSGFPEAIHCDGLIRYLELLTKRWKMNFKGVLLKPGTEQVRMQVPKKNEKMFHDFETLGRNFAKNAAFDEEISNRFKQLYVFPKRVIPIVRLMSKLGLLDRFWNKELKRNKAYRQRFAKPLSE